MILTLNLVDEEIMSKKRNVSSVCIFLLLVSLYLLFVYICLALIFCGDLFLSAVPM